MDLKTIQGGNKLKWDGKRRPFYEIYYIKVVHPQAQWSFWVRYTLLVPKDKTKQATAHVWAIFDHGVSGAVALKKSYALHEMDLLHSERFFQMGDDYLSLEGAHGGISGHRQEIAWHLEFEDPTQSMALYPHPVWYHLPFPKTKFIEPQWTTFLSGTIKANGVTHRLHHVPAHQAHIWGTQYARRWVWGHCNQFKEDPTAVFEGLVAQVPLGPVMSPPLSLFCFRWKDEIHAANQVWKWFTNESSHDLGQWQFTAMASPYQFVGHLTREPARLVGIEYEGPLGERRFCHNTMLAHMQLQVFKRSAKKWQLIQTLHAENTAAFETVEPRADSRVNFVL